MSKRSIHLTGGTPTGAATAGLTVGNHAIRVMWKYPASATGGSMACLKGSGDGIVFAETSLDEGAGANRVKTWFRPDDTSMGQFVGDAGTAPAGQWLDIVASFQVPTSGDIGWCSIAVNGAIVAGNSLAARQLDAWAHGLLQVALGNGGAMTNDYCALVEIYNQHLPDATLMAMTGGAHALANPTASNLLIQWSPDDTTTTTLPNLATGAAALAGYDLTLGSGVALSTDVPSWIADAPTDAPVLSDPTSVTSVGCHLAWTAVARAETYEVLRGGSIIGTTAALSYDVTGLTPSTSYTFTVRGKSSKGTGPESNSKTINTLPPDTTNPTPGTLTLKSHTDRSAVLTMTAGSDDVGVASRWIRKYSDAGLTTQIGGDIAAVPGDNTVTGLTPNASTWCVPVYKDAAGNEGVGAAVEVHTDPVASFPVRVVPGHWSAYLTFDLRDAAPNLYDPTVKSKWEWQETGKARLWWSTDGVNWKEAQDFKRFQTDSVTEPGLPPDPRMGADLFGLYDNATYHYKITFEGDDAWPTYLVQTGTFTTRTLTPPLGSTVATVTLDGTETNAAVYDKIRAAFDGGASVVELASAAGPGILTTIRSGVTCYPDPYFRTWGMSGTAEAWKCLRVKAGHLIEFDLSDPDWDVTGQGKWEPYTDATATPPITSDMGIYKSATPLPADRRERIWYERPGETVGINAIDVTAGLECLWGNHSGFAGDMQYAAEHDAAAYVIDGDGYCYLRLHGGIDPDTVRIKLPAQQSHVDVVDAHHVVFDGLVLKYGGAWDHSGGILLVDSSDIFVRNCRFVSCITSFGTGNQYNSPKNRVTLYNSTIEGRGYGADDPDQENPIPAPVWGWLKASKYETTSIIPTGTAWSLINNTVSGAFNGFGLGGIWPAGVNDAGFLAANDTFAGTIEGFEAEGNTFKGIGDDAMEPEQIVFGVAMTRNVFYACYKGYSAAPLIGAPSYFLRNMWLGLGEYEFAADWQSCLKMGNDDPGDTAYKLVAQNTIVSLNARAASDPAAQPLPGLMDSGAVFNHFYYNNYVSCDNYGIAYGYGSMGYPHAFDYNRYRLKRPTVQFNGSPAVFGFGRRPSEQGDPRPSTDKRIYDTFLDWQEGHAEQATSMPGFDGTVHDTPVISDHITGVGKDPDVTLPEPAYWLHDPHSSYAVGDHELVDPLGGNFAPIEGNADIEGAGTPLANITYDVGPRWAALGYEEAGNPTIGAVALGEPPPPNTPPTVTAHTAPTGLTVGDTFTVGWTVTDTEGGNLTHTVSIVTKPAGSTLTAGDLTVTKPTGVGDVTASDMGDAAGTYTLRLTSTDSGGLSAYADVTFTVGTGGGQGNTVPAVTMGTVTPASPTVGDTVSVAYSYADADTGQTHTATATLTAKPGGSTATAAATHEEGEGGDGYWTADAAGTYTVRVDVTDSAGGTGTATKSVTVAAEQGQGGDTAAPTPGAVNVLAVTSNSITVAVGAGSDDTGIVSRILTLYLDTGRTEEAAAGQSVAIGVNAIAAPLPATRYYGRVVYRDAAGNAAHTDFETETLASGGGAGTPDADTDSLLLPVRFQRGRPVNVGWQPVQLRARVGDTRPPITVLFTATDGVSPLNVSASTAKLLWREQGSTATLGTTDGAAVEGHTDRMAFDFPNPGAAGSYELFVQLTTDGETETCLPDTISLLVWS